MLAITMLQLFYVTEIGLINSIAGYCIKAQNTKCSRPYGRLRQQIQALKQEVSIIIFAPP